MQHNSYSYIRTIYILALVIIGNISLIMAASHYYLTFSSTLFILFLLGGSQANARKDSAGDYWRIVMKDEPFPEAIKSLVVDDHHNGVHCDTDQKTLPAAKAEKSSLQPQRSQAAGTVVTKFTEEIESQPQISAYGNDVVEVRSEPQISNYGNNDIKPAAAAGKFVVEMEPQPQISNYGNDVKLKTGKFIRDVEPQPQLSNYGGDEEMKLMKKKKFVTEIDSQPQISSYGTNVVSPTKFFRDIEPHQPQISSYDNDNDDVVMEVVSIKID